MSSKKRKDSFWLSYSDLMTSLFFVMLVLFIVCIVKMKSVNTELTNALNTANATKDQLEKILQLDKLFEEISKSTTLRYNEEQKTFIAKDFEGIEIFQPEDDEIKAEYLHTVEKVGRDLEKLLNVLQQNSAFKYLLIIEGNSANKSVSPMDKDRGYNYRLSYDRALALYNYWRTKGINLRRYGTEIQICGSGLNGINRDTQVEDNNKRFIIQIIPKISKPAN